jgi:RNA polymerase sigma factor (sigma-70 family)
MSSVMTQEPEAEALRTPTGKLSTEILSNREQFLRFLERRLGRRDAAEEILQAAYVKAMEKAATVEHEESTVAWFYRLLRNALIDHRRHQAIEERAIERHGQEVRLDAEQEDEPLKATVCGCVGTLVMTLKPEYADLVRRVDLEGASVQEAALSAGITPNNASVRLHRARAALRKQLELTCGACTKHGCLDCTCAHPPVQDHAHRGAVEEQGKQV